MPTATTYLGYELHNLGPATTAFKAPASCATGITYRLLKIERTTGDAIFNALDCSGPTYEGCLPNGKEVDRLYTQLRATPHNGNVLYRSPGISCPSGWTTAATIIGAEGGATAPSGIFTEMPAEVGLGDDTWRDPLMAAYIKPLGSGETLVWCCPSSYEAMANAVCASNLGAASDLSISSACVAPIPSEDLHTVSVVDGSTLSPPQLIISGTNTDYKTRTVDVPTGESISVVSVSPVVALVHKKSDIDSAASKTGDSEGSPSSTGDANGDGDEDDIAASIRPSLRTAILGAIVAVSVFSFFA